MGSAALRTGRKLKKKYNKTNNKNKTKQNKMYSLKGDITWTSSVTKIKHIKN